MGDEWFKHLIHGIFHSSRHELAHGNKKAANGLAMVGIGILLMPLPIVGLPLILMGIWKMCKSA